MSLFSREAIMEAIDFKMTIEDDVCLFFLSTLPFVLSTSTHISFPPSRVLQVQVHGGFEMTPGTGQVTVDGAREGINAWLPLYVDALHWQRAKTLLKPTLAYFCCLDPLAFHEYQIYVPFVILGTMACRIKASCSERAGRLFVEFRRTCHAILTDSELMTVADGREKIAEFLSNPSKVRQLSFNFLY